MNHLTKSLSRINALRNTAESTALRLIEKGGMGMLERMASPAIIGSGSTDWMGQSKNREMFASFRSWVYAAVNALASEAAGQPVLMARKNVAKPGSKRGLRKIKDHLIKRMPKQWRKQAGELEMLSEHEMLEILEHPNPLQHRYQFVYSTVANLNLTGRTYVVEEKDHGKKSVGRQFYALPTTWVKPDHQKGPFSQFYVSDPRKYDSAAMQDPIPGDMVAMGYMPNPADPMGCISPASSQSAAIRIDDRIQTTQEKFFDNGVFPGVIVTVGKDPHPDVPGGIRPRLTGTQRRQVTAAIRRVMGSVANYGNPAIVDGLIESITPFTREQSEIGWEKSEQTLKQRILSAFCVHPFILGEALGVGGYAQSYQIYDRFCKRINVFLGLLSVMMSGLANREAEDEDEEPEKKLIIPQRDDKLVIWWEETVPTDKSMEAQNWKFLLQNDACTRDEFRGWMGLSPMEDIPEPKLNGKMVQALQVFTPLVGMGQMQPDQLVNILVNLGLDEDIAQDVVGEGPPPPPDPMAGMMGGDMGGGAPGEFPPEEDQDQPPPEDDEQAALQELQKSIRMLRKPVDLSVKEIMRQLT